MKKSFFLLTLVISFVFVLFSCQDETEGFVYKPTSVLEPPEELSGNKSQVYITASDVAAAEFGTTCMTRTFHSEENEDGTSVIVYFDSKIDLYKIKVSHYYGWFKGVEYISSYKEKYQISAQTLSSVRARIEETGFAICRSRLPDDEDNYFGLDEIYSLTFTW